MLRNLDYHDRDYSILCYIAKQIHNVIKIHVYLYIYVSIYLSIYLLVYLSVYLCAYIYTYIYIYTFISMLPSTYLFVYDI